MRAQDFWDETLRDFTLRLKGHRKQEERRRQDIFEAARIGTTLIVNTQVTSSVKAKALWPLPWDKAEDEKRMEKEELDKLRAEFDDWELPPHMIPR